MAALESIIHSRSDIGSGSRFPRRNRTQGTDRRTDGETDRWQRVKREQSRIHFSDALLSFRANLPFCRNTRSLARARVANNLGEELREAQFFERVSSATLGSFVNVSARLIFLAVI